MLNGKGQIFTIDLILAVTLFLFVLTLTLAYSNQVANRVELWEASNERDSSALLASRSLVLSTGEPANWENLNVEEIESIGIVSEYNVIDPEKLSRLEDLNSVGYSESKAALGLAKYDAEILILDLNGNTLNSFGLSPDLESEVSSYTRIALLDGEKVFVKVKVFE